VSPTPTNVELVHRRLLQKLDKSVNSDYDPRGSKLEKKSMLKELKSLFKNKAFICLVIASSGLFFIVTGVQYWLPDYLESEIGVDSHTVNVYFSTTSFSAPVSGVVVGGVII
jgi:sugar phosphate permease